MKRRPAGRWLAGLVLAGCGGGSESESESESEAEAEGGCACMVDSGAPICCAPGTHCCGWDGDPACPLGMGPSGACAWDWCEQKGRECEFVERCCSCAASDCADCDCLVENSDNLAAEECEACDGVACGADPDCDARFPCADDVIALRGCCEDGDCAGLAPFCGRYTGAHNLCVPDDDR